MAASSNEYRLAILEDARHELLDLGAGFLKEDGNPEPTEAEIDVYFAELQEQREFEDYLLTSGEEPF